jgi:ribosomal protein S18 acetylase RimI-like enzyme
MADRVSMPRVAGPDDADLVVELLVGAFFDDPTWAWVFPDPQARRSQHRELWRLFVDGALRYPWVWIGPGEVATSVWIPPRGSELSDEQAAMLDPLLAVLLGRDAARATRVFEAFDKAHPRTVPHYYLSLLGTDPARRGHGHGLRLLADNLRVIDAAGSPAYLEASNPVNVALYERYGFERLDSFELPDGGPTVQTMWREPKTNQARTKR